MPVETSTDAFRLALTQTGGRLLRKAATRTADSERLQALRWRLAEVSGLIDVDDVYQQADEAMIFARVEAMELDALAWTLAEIR